METIEECEKMLHELKQEVLSTESSNQDSQSSIFRRVLGKLQQSVIVDNVQTETPGESNCQSLHAVRGSFFFKK